MTSLPTTLGTLVRHLRSQADVLGVPWHWLQRYLLYVLDRDVAFLLTDAHHTLNSEQLARLQAGIEQMCQGVPVAYLIGQEYFYGRAFLVNEHTLIPRPDTETLVDAVLDFVNTSALHTGKILDLGTGTGCIAISLACELNAAHDFAITASDQSHKALQVAQLNAKALGAVIDFVHGDWFDALPPQHFNIILSNPPYICADDAHLVALVAEPIRALVSDDFGMADIRHIARGARDYLSDGGLLALEHGYDQAPKVQALLQALGYTDIMSKKDLGHHERVTLGRWYHRSQGDKSISEQDDD